VLCLFSSQKKKIVKRESEKREREMEKGEGKRE
jgi:hypothetical protein